MKVLMSAAVMLLVTASAAQKQSGDKPLEREVRGQTLISKSNPSVEITFDKAYKYIGGQRWDLYRVADAEQHLFVKASKDSTAASFYWVQFEAYLPGNNHTYNYPPTHTTDIGGTQFIYDTRAYADYSGLNRNPESDGAYAQGLLEKHGYKFPKSTIRTRMIYLPSPDKRSELMIIYAESVDANDLPPDAEGGVQVDEQTPQLAKKILHNALSGMKVRRR
jgi:hypothetical protein